MAVTQVAQGPMVASASPDGRPLEDLLGLYKGLVEVCTLINAITDYNELLAEIMEVARRVMRAEGSALILRNERTDGLELVVARSITGEVLTAHQPLPRTGSIAGWCFEHGESALVPDAYADARFYPGVDRRTGLRTRSILCVPLCRNHRPIGVLQVINALGDGRPAFDPADQEALEAFANLAATAIEKLRFLDEQKRRVRFEQELAIATEIQQSFLPASLPDRADLSFAAQYRPALDVGGDFYDVFDLGPDEIYFVIGDVAGKGVPAALLMAQSLSILRLIIVPGLAPADAMTRWNHALCRRSLRGLFVTAALGRIVPSHRTVEIASAGHCPPWIISRGEGGSRIGEPPLRAGPPLALLDSAVYSTTALPLAAGDRMLFYTDGLTDCRSQFDKSLLGGAGAQAMLKKAFASPHQIVATLFQGEAAHRGDDPPQDDLTLLAFGFRA